MKLAKNKNDIRVLKEMAATAKGTGSDTIVAQTAALGLPIEKKEVGELDTRSVAFFT